MSDMKTQESKLSCPSVEWPTFSFFKRPIKNVVPCREMTIPDLYRYVVSDYAKETTAHLRTLTTKEEIKAYKSSAFDFVTPAGVFSRRADAHLEKASGYMVIDIDNLGSQEEVEDNFQRLLDNPCLETELLFRSPGGRGLKWFIAVRNNEGHDHRYYFQAVTNYLSTLGIVVDPSGKDVCRSCFIPHDERVYINPKYL